MEPMECLMRVPWKDEKPMMCIQLADSDLGCITVWVSIAYSRGAEEPPPTGARGKGQGARGEGLRTHERIELTKHLPRIVPSSKRAPGDALILQ